MCLASSVNSQFLQMGLPKVQTLSGEIPNKYLNDEVTSPLAFFSTTETIIRNENEPEEYEFLLLEEMEIGMVTEVSTSNEEVHLCSGDETVETEYSDSISKNTETESCNQDNQLSLEGEDNACESGMLEETVENVDSYENFDINCNFLEGLTSSVDQNLNCPEPSSQEIISDVENSDFVLSWLSSLNELTAINDTDLDISATLNDEIPAKEELRSFILTQKTKITDRVDRQDDVGRQHNLRPRNGNVMLLPRKHDGRDSSELQQLRRRQERNRIAAQRCRQKRTMLVDELSEESEKLGKENEELTSEIRDLIKELRMLQNVLLDHDLHSISSRCHERMSANIFSQELTELTNSL